MPEVSTAMSVVRSRSLCATFACRRSSGGNSRDPPRFNFSNHNNLVLDALLQRKLYSQETWIDLGTAAPDSASIVGTSVTSSSASASIPIQSAAYRARVHSSPGGIEDSKTAVTGSARNIAACRTADSAAAPAATTSASGRAFDWMPVSIAHPMQGIVRAQKSVPASPLRYSACASSTRAVTPEIGSFEADASDSPRHCTHAQVRISGGTVAYKIPT